MKAENFKIYLADALLKPSYKYSIVILDCTAKYQMDDYLIVKDLMNFASNQKFQEFLIRVEIHSKERKMIMLNRLFEVYKVEAYCQTTIQEIDNLKFFQLEVPMQQLRDALLADIMPSINLLRSAFNSLKTMNSICTLNNLSPEQYASTVLSV